MYKPSWTLVVHSLCLCLVHSYRKIPGDKCEGGQTPERKEINLRQRCVSDLLSPALLVSTSAYQVFTFCNFLQFLSHSSSAVVLTGRETPLQICTHCGNSHYCHAAECRRRSSLCQEICLWWQVCVFFNTHATKMYLLQACRIYRVIHNHLWTCPAGSWFTGTLCCSSMLRTMLLMRWMNLWRPATPTMARLSSMTTQMRYSGYVLLPHVQLKRDTRYIRL